MLSVFFRLIIIKCWLYILCFPAWLKALIYTLIFSLIYDIKEVYIHFKILYLKFFNFRIFSIKRFVLLYYFIYPIYFCIYWFFYFLVFFFKYFLILYFYFLILRKRTSFVDINFYYYFKLKSYYNIVFYSFQLFNYMVNYDLFNFVVQLIRYVISYIFYFLMVYFFPIILFPFKFIYQQLSRRLKQTYIYYKVKYITWYKKWLNPLFKKIIKKIYIFFDDWFLALLTFIMYLPIHIVCTFLPKVINYIIYYIQIISIHCVFYISFFFWFFLFILRFCFVYFINIFIYIFLNILYIIFYLLNFFIVYILKFFIFIFIFLNYYNLKLFYLDLKSLIIRLFKM